MTTKTRIQFPARAVTLGSLVALTAMAAPAFAGTQRATRTESVQCGDAYDRGALWRALFGEAWRGVWPEEVNVPVLDLETFGGGLTPFKEDGNQSKTLRFHGGDGRTYIFRSTEKNVQKSLPKDLKHTPISVLVQDQISSLHPTGHLVAAPLEKATGVKLKSAPMTKRKVACSRTRTTSASRTRSSRIWKHRWATGSITMRTSKRV
jgi:hypothetical protein